MDKAFARLVLFISKIESRTQNKRPLERLTMVLTHSDRCKRGASLIEGEMRKHSDHETESDEANDMSWPTMLKCVKYVALLVALLTKLAKRN